MDGRYGRWDSRQGLGFCTVNPRPKSNVSVVIPFPTRIGFKVMVGVALGSGQGARKLCLSVFVEDVACGSKQ